MNVSMNAFVGSGVTIDDRGRLCLPDGLNPPRVHRFIELCMQESHAHPRAAMHALFGRIGVPTRAVKLLNEILDERGDIELGAVARRSTHLMASLHEFQQIPVRFRDFLVEDLALADAVCENLEEAVASARQAAAERMGCRPTWDAILEDVNGVGELARPWRERVAAA